MKVEGVNELIARLDFMKNNLSVKLNEGVKNGGEIIQESCKSFAPVDTGSLQSSIYCNTFANGLSSKAVIGTDVLYAPYVEFGTGGGGEKWVYFSEKLGSFVTTSGQPPRPFIEQGFDASKEQAIELLKNTVEKLI